MSITPNDAARRHFEASGLAYENITLDDLEELHAMLVQVMAETRAALKDHPVQGHWRMRRKVKSTFDDDGRLVSAFLRCDGSYFEDREAVSFNRDGFIGFCGWASTTNTVPITDTFMRWCDRVAGRMEA